MRNCVDRGEELAASHSYDQGLLEGRCPFSWSHQDENLLALVGDSTDDSDINLASNGE